MYAILIRAPCARGGRTSIVSTLNGFRASRATAALQVMPCTVGNFTQWVLAYGGGCGSIGAFPSADLVNN